MFSGPAEYGVMHWSHASCNHDVVLSVAQLMTMAEGGIMDGRDRPMQSPGRVVWSEMLPLPNSLPSLL